jgi:phage N-6-adenine-methyltransferase
MNKNDEWYTPEYIIEKVKRVFGESIDLDPASNIISNSWICAKTFYTKEDNSLTKSWTCKNCFLNPPYSSKLINKFTNKLISEYESGNVKEFICLTNQGTDTKWNLPLTKYYQAFTIGRIKFITNEKKVLNSGSRGQCFTYAGPNLDRFMKEFNNKDFYMPNTKIHIKIWS